MTALTPRIHWLFALLLLFQFGPAWGQLVPAADSLGPAGKKVCTLKKRRAWYQCRGVRAAIVPTLLIGYGASTINDNGLYSSYEARDDLRRLFPNFRTRVDDYLVYAPYLELAGVALAGVESCNDRINTLLVIAKSEIIMATTVTLLKYTTRVGRPDTGARTSFPSGHTAQAFVAAAIVNAEFRDKCPWYGVGAYTVATSVAALRMLNNRHWESDVFAGAGIGIMSAQVAYLTHRNRWGRKPRPRADVSLSPTILPGGTGGLALTWRPK